MTLKEFKEYVANSEHKDWLQKYAIDVNLSHLNSKINLVGAVSIYEFVLKQIDGYSSLQPLPKELDNLRERFIGLKGVILQLVSTRSTSKHSWDTNLTWLINNTPQIFLYDSPETDFLIRTFAERPEYYEGVYEYLIGATNRTTQKNFLAGYILACEFQSRDFSSLLERKDAENKSIATIRADFQKKLGEAETEVAEYISRSNEKFNDYSTGIDNLKAEKEKLFTGWFTKSSDEFKKFNTESTDRIKELENLYIEKLKLEAPAQYWNKRAATLRKEGWRWLIGMIVCLVAAIVILICTLNMISNGSLQKIFSETSTAIKWSIAFITLISFLAYGIRTFAKLTFSSFHLVRDAEEREQLTYVYLALKKEQNIDPTERHLIMQSLFSRADSGLLKDDSGPTMPGNIVDQMTKKG